MQSAKLGPFTVSFDNSEEYHHIKREVWGAHCYYVEIENDNPVIVDAGAHIGLTTLYYKKLFPKASIYAYEPYPRSAELFRKNMYDNQIANVVLTEAALAESAGERSFYHDVGDTDWHSTAGFTEGAWTGDQTSERITVQTVALSPILRDHRPDLVKMDVEGAEEKVLAAAQSDITLCPHYLIEFHPVEGRGMAKIVQLFEDRGYTVTVSKDGSPVPWQKVRGLSMIEAYLR